jgi:hypothetical protein
MNDTKEWTMERLLDLCFFFRVSDFCVGFRHARCGAFGGRRETAGDDDVFISQTKQIL